MFLFPMRRSILAHAHTIRAVSLWEFRLLQGLLSSPKCSLTSTGLYYWSPGQNAAEDAPEAAENCPLHRAGQLSALACAATTEDPAVHL